MTAQAADLGFLAWVFGGRVFRQVGVRNMTTLPQTTGIRLPRPTGAAPPAVAGGVHLAHPGGGGGGGGAAVAGMSAADLWRVLRANVWLIGSLFVVACVVGYGVNWYLARYHSRFTSYAFIQVEPKQNTGLLLKDNPYIDWAGLQILQRTQVQYITSESLLSRVLTNPNSAVRTKTGWFKQFVTQQRLPDG